MTAPLPNDLPAVFERIAEINHWGNGESLSGDGSTLGYTHNLRHELPRFLRTFGLRSLFDAPCGDFNWMRAVAFPEPFAYVGGEIAPSILAAARRCEGPGRRFLDFDIAADPFPDVDLWFCRDCLFHLPFAAIRRALEGFARSNIPYAMLTNHLNTTNFENRDIEAGGFRLLDLHGAPFGLPRRVLHRIPDYIFPYPQRELCVWSRAQVAAALDAGG